MNTLHRVMIVCIILAVASLGLPKEQAYAYAGFEGLGIMSTVPTDAVPLVRLTGTLFPLEHNDKGADMYTLTVQVHNTRWTLKVKEAQDLTGNRTSLDILESIFPRTLYLRGPHKIMDSLRKPQGSGKPLVIEGNLYISSGILQVSSIA
jgi:hypothetical protein